MKPHAINAEINSQELQYLDNLINQMDQSFSWAPQQYQILHWLAFPVSMQLTAKLNIDYIRYFSNPKLQQTPLLKRALNTPL